MPRPRLLLAITVYNGRSFVPRCVRSAQELRAQDVDIDVLVLDDASPEPGFSEELRALCDELGVGCYRTPRNLGIVRNVNLALLRARDCGYDYVVVSNSDVIYPANFVDQLVAVARSDHTIGSVTAWSNNVSIYSVPNDDPDRHLGEQSVVDEASAALAAEFGTEAIDIPAGISFSMLITREAVAQVGLMDLVFGRGYCEETDWSRRSLLAGFRLVLAPGVFVYHSGRGSTVEAGLLAGGHTTVPANEAVIDLRYPGFRREVQAFVDSGVLDAAWGRAGRAIVRSGGAAAGYAVDVGHLERGDDATPRVTVPPEAGGRLVASYRGFHAVLPPASDSTAAVRDFFGAAPRSVRLVSREPTAMALAEAHAGPGVAVVERAGYPDRV